jgi:hypothetical protein
MTNIAKVPERMRNASPGCDDGRFRFLSCAATPVFAAMALYAGFQPETICSPMPASPFSGMALMYGLMAVFHAQPWIALVFRHWPDNLTVRWFSKLGINS